MVWRWDPSLARLAPTTPCTTAFPTPGSSVLTRPLPVSSLTPRLAVRHSTCAALVETPQPSSAPTEQSLTRLAVVWRESEYVFNCDFHFQQYFVCDWWYNIDCADQPSFYNLNDLLNEEPKGPTCKTLFCKDD